MKIKKPTLLDDKFSQQTTEKAKIQKEYLESYKDFYNRAKFRDPNPKKFIFEYGQDKPDPTITLYSYIDFIIYQKRFPNNFEQKFINDRDNIDSYQLCLPVPKDIPITFEELFKISLSLAGEKFDDKYKPFSNKYHSPEGCFGVMSENLIKYHYFRYLPYKACKFPYILDNSIFIPLGINNAEGAIKYFTSGKIGNCEHYSVISRILYNILIKHNIASTLYNLMNTPNTSDSVIQNITISFIILCYYYEKTIYDNFFTFMIYNGKNKLLRKNKNELLIFKAKDKDKDVIYKWRLSEALVPSILYNDKRLYAEYLTKPPVPFFTINTEHVFFKNELNTEFTSNQFKNYLTRIGDNNDTVSDIQNYPFATQILLKFFPNTETWKGTDLTKPLYIAMSRDIYNIQDIDTHTYSGNYLIKDGEYYYKETFNTFNILANYCINNEFKIIDFDKTCINIVNFSFIKKVKKPKKN